MRNIETEYEFFKIVTKFIEKNKNRIEKEKKEASGIFSNCEILQCDIFCGDIVRLKSGGPKMTVYEVTKKNKDSDIYCIGCDYINFITGEIVSRSFFHTSLNIVKR